MPSAKVDPITAQGNQGLIEALVALPPSEDASIYALFEEQRKDYQITGGVPLTMADLLRVSEVLTRGSIAAGLAQALAALPVYLPEQGDAPYF